MFLLILESLGSTELLFILVMALVFFGPRKLPQISRSLGKNLADFRRASEDFKRTWEKEVNLEESTAPALAGTASPLGENSILGGSETAAAGDGVQQPAIQAIAPDRVVARQSATDAPELSDNPSPAPAEPESDSLSDQTQPAPKSDWL